MNFPFKLMVKPFSAVYLPHNDKAQAFQAERAVMKALAPVQQMTCCSCVRQGSYTLHFHACFSLLIGLINSVQSRCLHAMLKPPFPFFLSFCITEYIIMLKRSVCHFQQ